MRSSIACARCRRSKIKCINNGIDSICVPCHQNSRECTYPSPAPSAASGVKRADNPSSVKGDGEGEAKRARKREPEVGGKLGLRIEDDPLENPPISLMLWRDIYALFTLHYSTDLPFLHEATFFDRIAEMQESGRRSRDTQIFLLGILSLTARFVPELVNHPFPDEPGQKTPIVGGNPLNASEFYARALEARLDAVTMARPSLDTIHALLMLGLYSWCMCRGMRSWMWVGNATRMAYAMGLSSEEDPDNVGRSDVVSLDEAAKLGVRRKFQNSPPKWESQAFVSREIKRRTMWSCFILDRYLSSGRARPQMSVETLHIQLPCSEEDFRFGTNVKTEFLYPDPDTSLDGDTSKNGNFSHIDASPVLGVYIRLVEIWGRFSKWSCAGGRREEKYPPWDKRTEFFKLRRQLDEFQASLPPKLKFTSSNLSAHVGGTARTVYTAIHTLYSLCQIVLHREYIPFIALRCDAPIGPLDEPTFPKEKFDVPANFWEESAEQIFKAAKNIVEIVRANSSRGFSIESPQVGFAIWTAAFVGVFSINFPHMDLGGHMNGKDSHVDFGGTVEIVKGATGLAVKILKEMSPRMKMAYGWSRTIKRMHEYFQGIIKDYNRSLVELSSPDNQARLTLGQQKLSLREGGRGGGLEEYKLLEKELKEFGTIEDDERQSTPTASERTESRASTSGPGLTPNIKTEYLLGAERAPAGGFSSDSNWAAVNNPSNGGGEERSRPPSYSLYGPPQGPSNTTQDTLQYHSYQSKGPAANPPSSMRAPLSAGPSPSFAQSEIASMPAPDAAYHQGHHQPMYPSAVQNTQRLLSSSESEAWAANAHLVSQPRPDYLAPLGRIILGGSQVAGFSDGLPFDMWTADGDGSANESPFMAALWNPQPPFQYLAG